jgi:DNA-binding NtrC family response regulator
LLEILTEELALRSNLPHPEFTAQAVALLCAQHWRGNVRELRNVIEQLLLRGDSAAVDEKAVAWVLQDSGLSQIAVPAPTAVAHQTGSSGADSSQLLRPLGVQVSELENQAIRAALQATGGNKLAAAKLLGMSRAKLYQCLA